jgi:hypothetical protein
MWKAAFLPATRRILPVIRAKAKTIFVAIYLDARDSIWAPAALERGEYLHYERAVVRDVLVLPAHVLGVAATARHLQNDGLGLALRLDEGEPHGLSITKYFAAYYSSFALPSNCFASQ